MKTKQFRLQHTKLFLTYNQLPKNYTKENLLDHLKQNLDIKHYIISLEIHQDGGYCLHAYLEFKCKLSIRNANEILDFYHNNKRYCGNYSVIYNKKNAEVYMTKHHNFITNKKIYKYNTNHISLKSYTKKLALEIGVKKALQWYIKEDPLYSYKGLPAFTKEVTKIYNLFKKPEEITIFDLKDLNNVPKEIYDWINQGMHSHLILIGESAIGKSILGKALLKEYNPLIIRDWKGLKEFDEEIHNSILFEDVNWNHLKFLDTHSNSSGEIIYRNKIISKDICRVSIPLGYLSKTWNIIRLLQHFTRQLKIINLTDKITINENSPFYNPRHNKIWNNKEDNEKNYKLFYEAQVEKNRGLVNQDK